jgi:hypothetical protein
MLSAVYCGACSGVQLISGAHGASTYGPSAMRMPIRRSDDFRHHQIIPVDSPPTSSFYCIFLAGVEGL